MIAISRCEDYRHDVWDVTAGAVLGSSVAYFTYRRYYPSLRDSKCHVPYDRADGSFAAGSTDGFGKLADDEERLLSGGAGGLRVGSPEDLEEGPSSLQLHMDDVSRG